MSINCFFEHASGLREESACIKLNFVSLNGLKPIPTGGKYTCNDTASLLPYQPSIVEVDQHPSVPATSGNLQG